MAGAIAASYSRYSTKLQSEESIDDQQRKCRERAEVNGHQLRPEFEFADSETSGALRDREGLDALLEGATRTISRRLLSQFEPARARVNHLDVGP